MRSNHLKKYWTIFWKFRKLRLMSMMEYRADFIFWSIVSTMWTFFNFFFFALIVNVSGQIGGWNKPEMYLLLSTFTILDAFTWSFFYANMSTYVNFVFTGELSYQLMKPIDAQYLLTVQDNSYSNTFRLLIGFVMLGWSLQQLHWQFSVFSFLLYIVFLTVALFFIYSLYFLTATFVFWVDRLDNIIELVPSGRRIWQVPRSVYIGVASTVFTVLLPLGLISSIPSEVLLGRMSGWVVYFLAFTVGLFLVARWFFLLSLRKYSSVGG